MIGLKHCNRGLVQGMKGLRLLCFLLLLMNAYRAFAVAPLPAEPVLTLQGIGAATAELGGLWQFRMGDDPQWAATAFDDSGWERIAPQRGWGEQGHFAEHGFAWYRLHLTAPAVAGVSPELALIIPHAQDVFQVYWNGRLVGQKGSFPPHASWPNDSVATTFNLGTEREGVLAIRIWKAPLISYDPGLGGGLMSPPLLGSPASVSTFLAADRYTRLRGIQLPMALALLYVLAAIGSFFAWLQHRQQPVFVWLCLFAIASTLQAGWWHSLAGLTYVQEALFATIYQPARGHRHLVSPDLPVRAEEQAGCDAMGTDLCVRRDHADRTGRDCGRMLGPGMAAGAGRHCFRGDPSSGAISGGSGLLCAAEEAAVFYLAGRSVRFADGT